MVSEPSSKAASSASVLPGANDRPAGAAGGRGAHHADRVQLVHHLGLGHQQRNGAKRFTAEVEIKAGADDPQPLVGQAGGDVGHGPVEELHFINGDDIGLSRQEVPDFGGIVDGV